MKGGFAPTRRQLHVLKTIGLHIAKHAYSPTLRELGERLGIRSTHGVNDHLFALERRGLLTRRGPRGMSRRLALTELGISMLADIAPPSDLKLDRLPPPPHFVIGPSFCHLCGATNFAPDKPCCLCLVERRERAMQAARADRLPAGATL